MTFDQLETLEMVVETGSFRAAAEKLRKTQPSLSIGIKKLEAEFDLTLFNRDDYRVKLTDEGRLFYNWAKSCLRSFRELESLGQELGLKKAEAGLTILVDPVLPFEIIQGVFNDCLQNQKATELTLRSEIIGNGTQLLLDNVVDFAITPKIKEDENLESLPLIRMDLMPTLSKRLLGKQKMEKSWLEKQTQIVVTSKEPKANNYESFGVLEASRKFFVTDHSLKYRLIREGIGWGRLADHEIRDDLKKGELIKIPGEIVKPTTLDLHVMRKRLRPMGPVARSIWAHLQETAKRHSFA